VNVTAQQLAALMQCPVARAAPFIDSCNFMLDQYAINTPLRLAHMCAQYGHETGSLFYMVEVWGPTASQARYDPPGTLASQLGNTTKGDGFALRGRGWPQLTGRANYQRASNELCIDFIAKPDELATPEFAPVIGGLFWSWKGLNTFADQDDITTITRRINGGLNGIDDRTARLAKCKTILGI
jgi:putative chitinase